jgi:transformation/transcription domain-associated protein
VDVLLQDGVLAGEGPACREALHPLAYSLLAELVHHVRKELSTAQLGRVIYIFSCNVSDASLPIGVQTTCVRLMINLVETLYSRRSADGGVNETGRGMLQRILESFVSKLTSIAKRMPELLASKAEGVAQRKKREESTPSVPYRPRPRLTGSQPQLEDLPPGAPYPVLYTHTVPEPEKEVTDTRQLMQTLIMGMKTLLFSINHYGPRSHAGMPGKSPPHVIVKACQKKFQKCQVGLIA